MFLNKESLEYAIIKDKDRKNNLKKEKKKKEREKGGKKN